MATPPASSLASAMATFEANFEASTITPERLEAATTEFVDSFIGSLRSSATNAAERRIITIAGASMMIEWNVAWTARVRRRLRVGVRDGSMSAEEVEAAEQLVAVLTRSRESMIAALSDWTASRP